MQRFNNQIIIFFLFLNLLTCAIFTSVVYSQEIDLVESIKLIFMKERPNEDHSYKIHKMKDDIFIIEWNNKLDEYKVCESEDL